MNMIRISSLLAFLAITLAEYNFKVRYIHLGDNEHVCSYGQTSDLIELNFNLAGLKSKRLVAWGKTGCNQWLPKTHVLQVIPAGYWTYIEYPDHYIKFEEKTQYMSLYSSFLGIKQTTTILSPAIIDGVKYNCTILGDLKAVHFGIDFPDYEPARFNIKCDNLTSTNKPSHNFNHKDTQKIEEYE